MSAVSNRSSTGASREARAPVFVRTEELEQRVLFAVTPSVMVTLQSGVLRVRGTPAADVIDVKLIPAVDATTAPTVTVASNGTTIASYPATSVRRLVQIDGRAGDDVIRLGQPGVEPSGFPFPSTITGSDGNDLIVGGDNNDKISGGNGNDAIEGGAGNDNLSGDGGDDVVRGGSGNDTVAGGGSARDVLFGGPGIDTFPKQELSTEIQDLEPTDIYTGLRWNMVWSDEFDGSAVDATRWDVADNSEPNYDGGINDYLPQNVGVSDGRLSIESDKTAGPAGVPSFDSGRVSTKAAWRYARVEIRAKLPGTAGIWPAIWMLPKDGTWPPEIDIMEMLGNAPDVVYMTHHWGSKSHKLNDQSSVKGADFSADYHLFTLEWEKGKLTWFIDGQKVKAATRSVPDLPMYLILNTSVGGDWPGMPNASTVFPQTFDVDYVRVYQRPGST